MAQYTGDDTANDYDGLLNESNDIAALGGNDTISGGYLHDYIDLGEGDDFAFGDDGSDSIHCGSGNDSVYGADGDDSIYSYTGLAGDVKELDGGSGDDYFLVGYGKEQISGDLGEDEVEYYYSKEGVVVDLLAGKGSGGAAEGDSYFRIEDVIGSLHADRLIGNGAFNFLNGDGGNDTIRGGAGGDRLLGGGGSDTLDYRSSDAGVRIDLAGRTAYGGDAQGDSFVGFENVDGTDFGDRLTGDSRANRLRGFDGGDRLAGGDGADILSGGGGADQLTGGKGGDALRGGAGSDRFVFRSTNESGIAAAARDEILDFRHGQHDRIDLAAIDANSDAAGNQRFDFIGTARFHGASGELRVSDKGADLLVSGDINGDKHADFTILLAGIDGLQASDFLL
ncbi:MAG: calcium-binding protein [Amaricoccus sp.]